MRTAFTLGAIALSLVLGGCWSGFYDDSSAQYLHRTDTITLSAGNAKDVNAATHVIDPWPRYGSRPRNHGSNRRWRIGSVGLGHVQ
jgi:hypothetical protein